jgi:alkylhydroperoxidase family enzyme
MEAGRVERIAEGRMARQDLDAGERALADLVRKTVVAPARLEPADLDGVVQAYGTAGAIEIVSVLTAFHFINRIADLVGIQSDLPIVQPRWRWLRRAGVRLLGWGMKRLADLSNQRAAVDVEACLREAAETFGSLPAGYESMREAPNVAAFLTTVARVARELDRDMVERVGAVVARSLPRDEEEATGFHARPAEPLEALAFVGTRYAARTTDDLVAAVRAKYGYGDAELTDLFYAISMHNGLARMNRLLAEPVASRGVPCTRTPRPHPLDS